MQESPPLTVTFLLTTHRYLPNPSQNTPANAYLLKTTCANSYLPNLPYLFNTDPWIPAHLHLSPLPTRSLSASHLRINTLHLRTSRFTAHEIP